MKRSSLRSFAATALVALCACGDDDGSFPPIDRGEADSGGGGANDAGMDPSADASFGDGGTFEVGAGQDQGQDLGPTAPESGALFADPNAGDDFAPPPTLGGACLVDETNAFGTPLGCESSACASEAAACCIGRSDCCEAPQASIDLDFSE